MRKPNLPGWQAASSSQLMPRSFPDADGNGTGDLAGDQPRNFLT